MFIETIGSSEERHQAVSNSTKETKSHLLKEKDDNPLLPSSQKNSSTPAFDGKKNLLGALREKYGSQYIIEEVKEAEPLAQNKLSEIWLQYAVTLNEQNKFSAATAFRNAKLEVNADNEFTVKASALTQQRFIEAEKTFVNDLIQQSFNNRSIRFNVLVEEDLIKDEIPAHLRMNSRQRFERIVEKYPLVQDFKNRLGLELDY